MFFLLVVVSFIKIHNMWKMDRLVKYFVKTVRAVRNSRRMLTALRGGYPTLTGERQELTLFWWQESVAQDRQETGAIGKVTAQFPEHGSA